MREDKHQLVNKIKDYVIHNSSSSWKDPSKCGPYTSTGVLINNKLEIKKRKKLVLHHKWLEMRIRHPTTEGKNLFSNSMMDENLAPTLDFPKGKLIFHNRACSLQFLTT